MSVSVIHHEHTQHLRGALNPTTPAEQRTCDYVAALTVLQGPVLLEMITRLVSDAYERGYREGVQYATERPTSGDALVSLLDHDVDGGRP